MRKVLNILFLISFGIVLTQDLIEAATFFILLFLLVLIARHVQRYLLDRRFKKDCEELFTEDFYVRLNTVIKNELK